MNKILNGDITKEGVIMPVDLGKEAPKIYLNSFPKSGTHLLQQILKGLPYEKSVHWLKEIKVDERGIEPGEIIVRHSSYDPSLAAYLKAEKIKTFFLYRDLRDVCVSDTFYITEIWKERHPFYEYYTKVLKNFDERLMATIKRVVDQNGFRSYMEWIDEPGICILRYEDLIRPETLDDSINTMISFLWDLLKKMGWKKERIAKKMKNKIDPNKSRTFRSGKSGEWKVYFTEEHKKVFKEFAKDMLIELGYEKSSDW